MEYAGEFPFSGETTFSNCAAAATDGMGSPLTAGDVVENNGEKADHKSREKGKSRDKKKRGTPNGTKADDDKKNFNRKNKGCKQNHIGQQQDESAPAGDTKDSHRLIMKEIEGLSLFKAALEGNSNEIRDKNPEALSSHITETRDTPLHVAIQTSRSNPFIRQLVQVLPKESLLQQNAFGNTALHNAAIAGNVEAAGIMVDKNSELPQITNNLGDTPLHLAAAYGHEEVVCFLLSVTRDVDPSPFQGGAGARLLNFLISAGFYGYAYDVIEDHPQLAIEKEKYWVRILELAHEKEMDGQRTTAKRQYEVRTPFTILAQTPEAFESKFQLGFCQRILHYVLAGNSAPKVTNNPQPGDVESQVIISETRNSEQGRYQKGTSNRQLKQIGAVHILELLIEKVMKHPSKAMELLASPLETAARLGNHVFIKKIIQALPSLILYKNEDGHNIFHISIIHCQPDVFNILFQMDSMKHFAIGMRDRNGNNMLHLAGMYKPSSNISGAALKMQREFQWFKEVENIVQPSFKGQKNCEGKTPKEVFIEKHKDLLKEGEKWMQKAASSSSVVAALVVTVMFAAAFTVPGGNNDIGAPLFLEDTKFLIFAVSVILGLLFSSISLLEFLGMFTSRYAVDDFLVKLPRKLVIGLVALFISLAAMLVAFSASIHILLYRRISWILIPVGLLAMIPVFLYAFTQSPLLYQIVKNTFVTGLLRENTTKRIFWLGKEVRT